MPYPNFSFGEDKSLAPIEASRPLANPLAIALPSKNANAQL